MNYGKEIFDKLIQLTNTKPVSMAFEFPNKALINFLYKNYNINNPIYQANNIITYFNFSDNSFNKYLDDYHRIIDVNQMENDIDNYRKWSPYEKDYKIYNSENIYKKIFPLQFKTNKDNLNKYNFNRYNESNLKNFENNYFNNKFYNKNDKKDNVYKLKHSFDYLDSNNYRNRNNLNKIEQNNDYNSNYYNKPTNINNIEKNKDNDIKKEFHLLNKKNIYGTQNNNIDNLNNLKKINTPKYKKDDYYYKFNDYYLNRNNNFNSLKDINSNIIKDNYYNYMNNENSYFQNMLNKQKERNDKLNENINNLNERIKDNINRTPNKNNYNNNIYYHKNRSFATIYDSIQNKLQEEKDFNEFKKYQIEQDYSNL